MSLMKKDYIQPSLLSDPLLIQHFICADSPNVTGDTGSGNGPGYGGVDEEGEVDPSIKAWNEWETGLW